MSNKPTIKLESQPSTTSSQSSPITTTTTGGVDKKKFKPNVHIGRKSGGGNQGGLDLLVPKVEVNESNTSTRNKSSSNTTRPPARVSFQPSSSSTSTHGIHSTTEISQQALQVLDITHNNTTTQDIHNNSTQQSSTSIKADPHAVTIEDEKDVDMYGNPIKSESQQTENNNASLLYMDETEEERQIREQEEGYNRFLDNGDPIQYRPILLPFPKPHKTLDANKLQQFYHQPHMKNKQHSTNENEKDAMDIDSTEQEIPELRNSFPSSSPAHLLSLIDYHEKISGKLSRELLFFQLPSHLPFKQAADWQPPTMQHALQKASQAQSTTPPSSSTTPLSSSTTSSQHTPHTNVQHNIPHINIHTKSNLNDNLYYNAQRINSSPSLQALSSISSPMLPPLYPHTLPQFSLNSHSTIPASTSTSTTSTMHNNNTSTMSSSSKSSMKEEPSSSYAMFGVDDEEDLGEIRGDGVGNSGIHVRQLGDSERLAKEHRARQQRKLLLFSANFEHAIRHLPAGQLGSLLVYKSGKIKMKIGDIVLQVNQGVPCAFHQEIMAIQTNNNTTTTTPSSSPSSHSSSTNTSTSSSSSSSSSSMNDSDNGESQAAAYRFGTVQHRMICTMDVDDIIDKTIQRSNPAKLFQ